MAYNLHAELYGAETGTNIIRSKRPRDKGIAPHLLERNRAILKEYYSLVDREGKSTSSACSILAKNWQVTPQQIRNILTKMRQG